jgi:predicted MFS family arabinose efflux permease
MPTVASELGGSSISYGLLLGSFGIGAVLGALQIQWVRSRLPSEAVLAAGTVTLGGVLATVGFVRVTSVLCVVLLVGGAAWTIFMSLLNTLVQNLAPDHVRARVLAAQMLVFQGGVAAGSALWGAMAERVSLHAALLVAGAGSAASVFLQLYSKLPDTGTPLQIWSHRCDAAAHARPAPRR